MRALFLAYGEHILWPMAYTRPLIEAEASMHTLGTAHYGKQITDIDFWLITPSEVSLRVLSDAPAKVPAKF
jgi:hypothetical protein